MRLLILSLALVACGAPSQPHSAATETTVMSAAAPLLTWGDLLSRPLPTTPHHYTFGPASTDVADLWLPDSPGPYPVVLMVHGGCWQKEIADRTLMNYAAEDLRQKGMAVWNVEYRGVDEEGGGYPGTFTDVARAADALRLAAADHPLELESVVAFGHSAGGHLALWLAARANLPVTSPLYAADPLPIAAVVNSGGLADLEASAPVTQDDCLASIMDVLTGPPSDTRPNVFADTSPSELLPMNVVQVSMNGDSDRIAPAELGKGYTDKAIAAGDRAEFVLLEKSGHVELITPGTTAFEAESDMILRLLAPER